MKAHEVIADSLADWSEVRNAPALARDTFDRLSDAEKDRLALLAYAAEIRKALTRKVNGVPVYSSVDVTQPDGSSVKRYKQTEAFDVADYSTAITSYEKRGKANFAVAKALRMQAEAKFGPDQLALDGTGT